MFLSHSSCGSPRHFRPDSRHLRRTSTRLVCSDGCGTGTRRSCNAAALNGRWKLLVGTVRGTYQTAGTGVCSWEIIGIFKHPNNVHDPVTRQLECSLHFRRPTGRRGFDLYLLADLHVNGLIYGFCHMGRGRGDLTPRALSDS